MRARWILPFVILLAATAGLALPEPVRPAPSPGDQAYYAVSAIGPDGSSSSELPVDALSVTWGRDAVRLQFLAETTTGPREVIRQFDMEKGTDATWILDGDDVVRRVRFGSEGPPCGLGPLPIKDGCNGLSEQGRTRLQGDEVRLFVGPDETLWMLDGVAVPLRVEASLTRLLGSPGPDGHHRLDLLGFRASGADAWTPDAPAVIGPARLAPRQPWGPAEGGLEHPFLLSDAYHRAQRPPAAPLMALDPAAASQESAFAEFLATDRAYLASASGRVVHAETTQWYWHLVAADGTSTEETILRYMEGPTGPDVRTVTRDDVPYPLPLATGRYPSLDRLPTEMPVVASAMARFAELDPRFLSAAGPDAYGFTVTCRDASCIDIDTTVDVGRDAWFTGATMEPYGQRFLLTLDASGAPIHLTEAARADPDHPELESFSERPDPVRSGLLVWGPPVVSLTLGAAVVAAVYAAWPMIKGGVAALFSRIRQDRLLDDPARRSIHGLVEAEPGIHAAELGRRLDLAEGKVRYHVRRLVDGGLVVARPHGNEVCLFVKAQGVAAVEATVAVRSEGARRVLAAVRASPSAPQTVLAEVTGLSLSTTHHHLSALEAAGLIVRRRDGRRKVAELTDAGRAHWAQLSNQPTGSSYSPSGGL